MNMTILTLYAVVNAAWPLINTAPLKASYDANAAPGGFAAP